MTHPEDDPSVLPKKIRAALLPPADLSVAEFLSLAKPKPFHLKTPPVIRQQKDSQKAFNTSLWFSSQVPNEIPGYVTQLTLPEPRACVHLPGGITTAVEQGCNSVVHPYRHGIRWPLWVARAYCSGYEVLKKAESWNTRLDWLELSAEREAWSPSATATFRAALAACPYNAGLPGLQRGAAAAESTFGELLSRRWLSCDTLNCMLDVLRYDYQQLGTHGPAEGIASTYLGQTILNGTLNSNTAQSWGRKLSSNAIRRLFFPVNVDEAHWIAVGVDVDTCTISIGDSLPTFTADHVPSILQHIKAWLEAHLPNISWRINLTGLTVALQRDKSSCGVTAVNAIHVALCPGVAPRWSSERSRWMRAYYFERCVSVGKSHAQSAAAATHADACENADDGTVQAAFAGSGSVKGDSPDEAVGLARGVIEAEAERREELYRRVEEGEEALWNAEPDSETQDHEEPTPRAENGGQRSEVPDPEMQKASKSKSKSKGAETEHESSSETDDVDEKDLMREVSTRFPKRQLSLLWDITTQ
ncbi:hypothetical protein PsYK624_119400 [Phanerochaete sordida]|uniref:Ubiquitin-like protease family profile domain-containing protein n=1 Tax=Phanerochaete sordida TaxID=48140 RepID=A0A9P3GIW0_9APHY|nr:hypothetical protein PsYK624_119400 [Phanerochaete sordida]